MSAFVFSLMILVFGPPTPPGTPTLTAAEWLQLMSEMR